METSLKKIHEIAETGALDIVKQRSRILFDTSEILKHQVNTPVSHGLSRVMFQKRVFFKLSLLS